MMLFFFPNPPRPLVAQASPFPSSSSLSSARSSLSCLLRKKSFFLGETLPFSGLDDLVSFRPRRHPRCPEVMAVVKRRKELPFDNVIQRDKKLKLVLKIRKILVSQPDRIMNLRDLGRYRKELGLTRKRRFIALLKRFPGVFEIMEEGVFSLKFKLTPEAERIYLEELRMRNEAEDMLVIKLRKLLMMSLHKRILLEKIAHLGADLGLPPEFRSTICERYPQYFKVTRTDRGPALELTSWDPELAVSAAEASAEEMSLKEVEERDLIIDRPLKFKRVKLPRGLNLSKGEMRRISQFREMPYISPYSDFSELQPGTPEKEKHACGVVHEILSLTTEKKTLVDHLTHFREEFRFSQQLRGMIIRHPDMFYVSLKGDRDSVFLREAYRDSQLIDKDRLTILKEKMRALLAIPRFPRRHARDYDSYDDDDDDGDSNDGDDEDDDYGDDVKATAGRRSREDLEGDWSGSDIDDNEDDDDEEADPRDLWTDGDDDDDDGGIGGDADSNNWSGKKDKILLPVHPEGRQREQW